MDNENMGTVTVSRRAVIGFAAEIAKRADGVAELRSRSRRDDLACIINHTERGVYYSVSGKKRMLDIYVAVRVGANAHDVCAALSKKIQSELANVGIVLDTVSIHAVGIVK